MDIVTQPKLFISYARADGESAVREFWNNLQEYLKSSQLKWSKWDYKEIQVGEEWDKTINEAQVQKCNCCMLLISDLFAKSSYILEKEWPKTLASYEKDGMIFFPVIFGVLQGGLAALPTELNELSRFQVYWPTVAELFKVRPAVSNDQVRLGYKEANEQGVAKDYFLSSLANLTLPLNSVSLNALIMLQSSTVPQTSFSQTALG